MCNVYVCTCILVYVYVHVHVYGHGYVHGNVYMYMLAAPTPRSHHVIDTRDTHRHRCEALPACVADGVDGPVAGALLPRLRTYSSGSSIVDPGGLGVSVFAASPGLALGRPWVPVDVVIVMVSVLTVACGLGVAWFNYLIPEGALTSWSWMFVLMLPQVHGGAVLVSECF